MADKELNIKVNAFADSSEIEDLSAKLNELQTSAGDAQSSLDDLNSSTEIDASGVDNLASSADDASSSLDDTSTSADEVSNSASNIDNSGVDNLADSASNAQSSFSGLNDEIQSANESLSMVDAMAGAELSGQIVSGYTTMANAAGNYEDSMVRLGYALSNTSMTAEQAQSTYGSMISSMAEETGRGAGAVRQHLINMGNVGITNQQVLEDSFEGISKAAFQTQIPIENLDSAFQTMVLSGMAGKRQLKNFGLSLDDLGKAMGVSADEASKAFQALDENSRAAVLSSALNMKYGADVTENYKNSYEHLNEELQRSKDYFLRVVGEALLPTLIPAIQTAADLINILAGAFHSLPEPIQGVIGAGIGLSAGLTTVGLGIQAVTKFIGFALSPFTKLMTLFGEGGKIAQFVSRLSGLKTGLMSVASSAKSAILGIASFGKELLVTTGSAIKNAVISLGQLAKSVLLTGYNALKSAAMWVAEKAALIASTVAEYAAAAAQWALNIAMDANPIGILILAIGALVAILGYLYFNNEQVRAAIDGLGQSFVALGQWIYSGAIYWLGELQNTLTGLWEFLTSIGELISGTIIGALESFGQSLLFVGQLIWGTLITAITTLQSYIMTLWATIVSTASMIWSTVVSTITQIWASIMSFIGFFASLPATVASTLMNIISRVLSFAGQLASNMMNAARNAVSNFASGISGLAGKLKAELEGMISDALNFAGRIGEIMWQAATNAWQNFLNGLDTHSPGIMQRTLLWEVSEMGRRVPIEGQSLVKNLGTLAKDAVSSFGKPEMNLDFGEMKGEFANGSIQRLAESQGNTQEINIIINGDIDNEDRLQYFVDRIRSEMNWNNRTAGRSV